LSARALMFQGTGSDVGKSLVVAGLCRAFASRGLEVRPFKPQNMSNNAAVTPDGGEIGRAQALQARACRVAPSVHMNPVLLKPQSETGAQVVVRGRVVGAAKAREYQAMKPRLMAAVLESFGRLKAEADLVLVEGAGSAAEVNLRSGDIANMGFARAADTPVILIGDIDRGGVIAQIVGTKVVIAPEDAAMVVGFLINKFRGDPSLFAEGLRFVEERTSWPSLGMIPHFAAAQKLPAEDAMALERAGPTRHRGVTIAVPRLARIANFDEFDPLSLEPNVDLVMVAPGEPLPVCDLVILPGSKATIADLAFLRAQGWDIDLFAHVRRGGRVLGLDPEGAEGPAAEVAALGLLDVETTLWGGKALVAVAGTCLANGARFEGYEMHIGRTTGPGTARPLLRYVDGRQDGAISQDGLVMGAYAHGLFAADSQRAAWLATLGVGSDLAYDATVERTLDELAAHLAEHVDLDRLIKLARY
jgi:adenosylcobyric acid synthase